MSKQSKRWVRTIALIMSFVLIVYFTPVQSISASDDTSTPSDVSTDIASDTPVEETTATVMCEDVSLREENVKHFIMSNHTYRAVVYSAPVHYEKDGEWVDINNSLIDQAAMSDEDFAGQITTDGPFKVKFANSANSSKLVRIDKNGYRLSWSYQSATKRNANGNVKASVKSGDLVTDAVAN